MSTDLYGIRVLDVALDERRIRLRTFVVYYDTGYEYHQPIPADRSFFVRVLCDHDALGSDITDDQRFDENYVDRNAFRYIERIEELERRNHPVESFDDYADFYYERDGAWQDEEKLVQADFDVWVTREEYLEPFAPGQSWGTTAYPTAADALTAADYPRVPDFADVAAFVPFPDSETEASTASRLSFSPDGSKLMVANDAGGFRVFSTSDASVVSDAMEVVDSLFVHFGWTADGRVGFDDGDGFRAIDPETGDSEPFEPFGYQANSTGTRFVTGPDAEDFRVFDHVGEVLYETEAAADQMKYASFDASGNVCFFALEGGPLRRVDLTTGAVDDVGHVGFTDLAVSPDGAYVAATDYQRTVVIRASDRGIVREMRQRGRIPVAVAWSPDGRLIATTTVDSQGYHSTVSLHRSGRALLEDEQKPVQMPSDEGAGLPAIADLYVRRTTTFGDGWRSHIDDDLLDFHVTLASLGHDSNLVGRMHQEHTAIAALAHEAVVTADDAPERARRALDGAIERLESFEPPEWAKTSTFAPLAAAHHALGEDELAASFLGAARGGLGDEANPFQKRLVLCRALLELGEVQEVRSLIEEASPGHIHTFHTRTLVALVEAQQWELLALAFREWNVADDRSAPGEVHAHLLRVGAFDRAVSLDWLGSERRDLGVSVTAWVRWYAAAPEAAAQRFAELGSAGDDQALQCMRCVRQPELASRFGHLEDHYQTRPWWIASLLRAGADSADEALSHEEDPTEVLYALYETGDLDVVTHREFPTVESQLTSLGLQEKWEEAYALVNAAPRNERDPLFATIATVASRLGAVDLVVGALDELRWADMNSRGVRSAREAFRTVAGAGFRSYHP